MLRGTPSPADPLRRVAHFFALVPFAFVALLSAGAAHSQASQVFNRYGTQPDVWRPAQTAEPGVDARGDLHLSVPVLTVPGVNGLDFEVRFSYTSGVRFDQRGGWVGTGWHFDPGSITRDVFGVVHGGEAHHVDFVRDYDLPPAIQPDQYYVTLPRGGSAMVRAVPGGSTLQLPPRYNTSGFFLTEWRAWRVESFASDTGVNPSDPVVVTDAAGNQIKTQVYRDGQYSDRADYERFIVTDEHGTRYVFDRPTIATYLGMTEDGDRSNERYVSTWRLVSILGPDYHDLSPIPEGTEPGSWVRFTYTPVQTAFDDDPTVFPDLVSQGAYLSEILTPTHRAVFTTTPRTRENFSTWEYQAGVYRRLDRIQLYTRCRAYPQIPGCTPSVPIRQVDLDFFPENEGFDHSTSASNRRLALRGIRFFGRGGTAEGPGYRFTYHPRPAGGTTPDYMDLFGFFDSSGGGYHGDFNADCENGGPCNDGAAWSLATITYPTGGSDAFAYENDAVEEGETAFWDLHTYNVGTASTYGIGSYPFTSGMSTRQGGARVTTVTRRDGMGGAAVTTYAYGAGHVSGAPPRYWEYLYGNRTFYAPTERSRAAVYYQHVERTDPDGGRVRTSYTYARATSATASTGSHPGAVVPLRTLVWKTGTGIFIGPGMTLVQGNQDWNWGRPYETEHFDRNGRRVREVRRDLDLTSFKLAAAWSDGAGVPEIRIVWGYEDKLDEEEAIDYGAVGSSSTSTVTSYLYFTNPTAGTPTTSTGNGLVRQVEVRHNDGRRRRTEYTYGCQKYGALVEANRLADVAEEVVSEVSAGGAPTYLSARATTWQTFQGQSDDGHCPECRDGESPPPHQIFMPHRSFAWDAEAPSPTKPGFTAWTGGMTAGWQLKETTEVWSYTGRRTRIIDARGHTTILKYDYAHGWVLTVSKATGVGGVTLGRSYTYDPHFPALASVVDENGHATSFTYDAFGRLSEVRDRSGRLATSYVYDLACASPTACTATTPLTRPNDVTARRHFGSGAGDYYETISFYDGLGRLIQTQERDDAGKHVVTATEYAPGQGATSQPRRERTWKPVSATTGAAYYPLAAAQTAATSAYGTPYPHTDTEYTADGTGRTARVAFPYAIGVRPAVVYTHAVGSLDGRYYAYTETTDEAGDRSRTYADAWGNAFRTVNGLGTPEEATTHTVFDALGRAGEVRPPNYFDPPHGTATDWRTLYAYDTQGRLTSRDTPDAGPTLYKYDAAGNLRYSQDANQDAAGEAVFTTYDGVGRPLTTGVFPLGQNGAPATFAGLNPNPPSPPTFETASANWVTVHHYDAAVPTTGAPWSTFASQIGGVQGQLLNPAGHLVATASKSDGAWQVELSAFDDEERYARRYVYSQVAPGGAIETSANTEIVYTYNVQGQLLTREAAVGSAGTNRFRHWYTYTGRGLPATVKASTGTTPPSMPDVTYTYHPTGAVASQQFAARPAVPHTYDLRDRLTNLGGTTLSNVPFATDYTYAADGSVTRTEFGHRHTGGITTSGRFDFAYDGLDRLTGADYTPGPSSGRGNLASYDLSAITYDGNGNLRTLTRRDQAGAVVDQLTYEYQQGTNRLAFLSDAANGGAPTAALWDVESGLLGHDSNGNVTWLPPPYGVTQATYDHRNLPIAVKGAEREVRYRYASSGQRYSTHIGEPFGRQDAPEAPLSEGPEGARPAPASRAATDARRQAEGVPRRYAARFGRDAGTGATPTEPSPRESAAGGTTTYYALDALGQTGTQPTVGAFTSASVYDWNLLTPSGDVVGRQPAGGARLYYHKDLLGSTRAVVDASGAVKEARMYDAWGVLLEGYDEVALGAFAAREGYTGKERDAAIGGVPAGLDYFGARTYAPTFGRFLQTDPLAGDYPGWSPYTYTLDNPTRLVDPDGAAATPSDWYHIGGRIVWRDHSGDLVVEGGKTYRSLGRNVLVGWHNRDPVTLEEPINSARFELYLESKRDGPTATINGNTVPADVDRYGTLREGLYPARFQARRRYPGEEALIIGEGGPLPTVQGNPNNGANAGRPISEHIMTEIFLHIGNTGRASLTYTRRNGTIGAISEGCQTGPHGPESRLRWNAFMEHVPSSFRGNYYLPKQPGNRHD